MLAGAVCPCTLGCAAAAPSPLLLLHHPVVLLLVGSSWGCSAAVGGGCWGCRELRRRWVATQAALQPWDLVQPSDASHRLPDSRGANAVEEGAPMGYTKGEAHQPPPALLW